MYHSSKLAGGHESQRLGLHDDQQSGMASSSLSNGHAALIEDTSSTPDLPVDDTGFFANAFDEMEQHWPNGENPFEAFTNYP